MLNETWDTRTCLFFGEGDPFFVFITPGPCEGHFAWYVLNEQLGEIHSSGSDDELEAAKENAMEAFCDAVNNPKGN